MRLDEITQRELDTLSRRSTRWADKFMNLKPKKRKNRQWWESEYEDIDWDLRDVLGPYLEKKGLKELGQGAFAIVYGRPGSNRVVKVSKGSDRCWLMYANWAMGQQHKNPHVPDIHHLESYMLETPDVGWGSHKTEVFFAVMEKLLPFEEQHINFDDESNLALLAYLARHEGFYAHTKLRRRVGHEGYYDRWHRSPEHHEKIEKYAKMGESHRAIRLFNHVEKKWKSCSGDFHGGNIMIRPKTGEFVITDPLAG